ncbi:MAG: glycoside hydrolase family 97 catalytic domain-containing protein [Bacteroidales bacterium]|nr:glycoside hydrolase family 97 catalytic domain-containing protein [Bacteroidales bacterium]
MMNLSILKHFTYLIGLFSILALTSCQYKLGPFTSPDKQVILSFMINEGVPEYNLTYNDVLIMDNSSMGIALEDSSFKTIFILKEIRKRVIDTIWKPVLGKVSKIRNHYNQWTILLEEEKESKRQMEIIFRVYNNGVALRYNFPQQDQMKYFTITDDKTTFHFADNISWWSGNGEHENPGPLPADSIPKNIRLPFVAKYSDSLWIAIHEAAIYHYSDFTLGKVAGQNAIKCRISPSKGETDIPTSWRLIMLGTSAGAMLESNILQNLNPPNKIKDPSWILPGKSMWDWRVWGYKADDGFTYGLNTISHKRFVDFASENNIRYMLLDADWYGPEFEKDSDPTKAREGINIEAFMKYAHSKNVGVILYLNDIGAKKYGLETILSRFHDWGAAGVKYGFMSGSGQEKVLHTREVVRLCAKYKLLINFHDNPVPPSGDTRTWPNLIAREYCHAQADAKRSYFPETSVSAAFINMLTGPLDMTNGWYDLNNTQSRVKVFEAIPGTVSAETAKLLVYYSGLMVLPDAPEEYQKKADLFDFIKHLPDNYDKMIVLSGTPDSYISLARRKGENWYIGNLTNRTGRTLNIPLTFLDESKKYKAIIYEDAPDSHYLENKEAYQIRSTEVTAETVLALELAPGGGSSVMITPIKLNE